MYHYINDKEFLRKLKYTCSDIINQLVQAVNNDGILEVEAQLVGSGAKNLIMQNAREPVDLDYNLNIVSFNQILPNDGRKISEYIQTQFDFVLQKNDWDNCEDSTSVFSTRQRYFTKGNHTLFKIDLAIVKKDSYGWHRLIHHKTGNVWFDQYYWNKMPDSKGLDERVAQIKREFLWNKVKEVYEEKKNMYLSRQDDRPSFKIYIETVNEVYYQYLQ